jgi:hypothetical protein
VFKSKQLKLNFEIDFENAFETSKTGDNETIDFTWTKREVSLILKEGED